MDGFNVRANIFSFGQVDRLFDIEANDAAGDVLAVLACSFGWKDAVNSPVFWLVFHLILFGEC